MARALILSFLIAIAGCPNATPSAQTTPTPIRSVAKPTIWFHGEKTTVDLGAPDGSEFPVGRVKIKLIKSLYGSRKLVEIEVLDPSTHNAIALVAKRNIDQEEIERTQKAQGPGVILSYGYFYDKDGEPILVVEKMAHDLFSVPYEPRFLNTARENLQRLHDMGIIHTDIKPPNMMFDSKMDLKFIDFTKSLYGTTNYSQWKVGTKLGDFYALGITMLEWKAQDKLKNFMPTICDNLNVTLNDFIFKVVEAFENKGELSKFDQAYDYRHRTERRIYGYKCWLAHDLLLNKIHDLERKPHNEILTERINAMPEKPDAGQLAFISKQPDWISIKMILRNKYGTQKFFAEFMEMFWARMKTDLVSPSESDGKIIWDLIEKSGITQGRTQDHDAL